MAKAERGFIKDGIGFSFFSAIYVWMCVGVLRVGIIAFLFHIPIDVAANGTPKNQWIQCFFNNWMLFIFIATFVIAFVVYILKEVNTLGINSDFD